MAESTSGEDQVNPVSWLATCTIPERVRGGQSCLEFLALVLQAKLEPSLFGQDNLNLFCIFIDLDFVSIFEVRKSADRTFLQSKI